MNSVGPSELIRWLNSNNPPHLLDVREPDEHRFVALPHSTLIPLGEISERASEIASWKSQDIVVYCHHGIRSNHAISQLQSLGFEKLHNLMGGIDRYSREIDSTLARY